MYLLKSSFLFSKIFMQRLSERQSFLLLLSQPLCIQFTKLFVSLAVRVTVLASPGTILRASVILITFHILLHLCTYKVAVVHYPRLAYRNILVSILFHKLHTVAYTVRLSKHSLYDQKLLRGQQNKRSLGYTCIVSCDLHLKLSFTSSGHRYQV